MRWAPFVFALIGLCAAVVSLAIKPTAYGAWALGFASCALAVAVGVLVAP